MNQSNQSSDKPYTAVIYCKQFWVILVYRESEIYTGGRSVHTIATHKLCVAIACTFLPKSHISPLMQKRRGEVKIFKVL